MHLKEVRMRKFAVCIVASTMGALGLFAAEFPYGVQSWSKRFASSDLVVNSLTTPYSVAEKSAMPASDSLAVVTLNNAKITAMDEETWTEAIAAISQTDVQAAFTLKLKDDTTLVWMGYSGGAWRELSGVTPKEGQWDVKIEFDYSLGANALGANARKIRYLIRPAGNENNENVDYTPLTHGGSDWIAIGVEKAVIAGVDLYGFGTASAAGAESGARQASGTASGVAECSMDYSDLKLTVTRSSSDADTWADQIQVVVKKDGTELGTATAALPATGASAVIDLTTAQDLAGKVVPGETYDYDVFFSMAYGGETQKTAIADASGTIHMFSAIDWFGFNGKEFVNATTTNITVDANKFGATDDELKGAISPDKAADEGQQTIVTSALTVTSAFPDDELTAAVAEGSQFAVALASTASGRVWKYFNGTEWVADTAGIPTVNGDYVGTATFDYRDGEKTVTYTIEYGGVTNTLASGVSLGDNKKLNGVDIMGGGFGEMNALCKTTGAAPVVPKDGKITLETNSKVDLADLSAGAYTVESAAGKSFHLRWDDAGGKYAKMSGNALTVVSGTPANGISSFLNYAFGLDKGDTDKTDLPVAVIKPGVAQTDSVEVYVPNVNPPADSGYTVYFQIQRKFGDNGAWENYGSEVKAGAGQLKIPLTDAANPYLYRVKTLIR